MAAPGNGVDIRTVDTTIEHLWSMAVHRVQCPVSSIQYAVVSIDVHDVIKLDE